MSARTHLPGGLVTFLFTDIEGSTRLAQMLGPAYRDVLNTHRRILRSALSTGDGVELFTEGDSFFVAFPDASAALRACAVAQRRLAGHDWPDPDARPLVRMGLHTGYAEPVGGEYASPEVHRAARVAAAAHGGQVLCSAATAAVVPACGDYRLYDLGLHRLRGFDGRERLFQLVAPGLDRHFPRPRTVDRPPHNLPAAATSFVGRAAERADLAELLRGCRQVSVVGAAGAGKTRLAVEVAGDLVGEYPDGVWFVDLAGVEPGGEAAAVGAALGIRPEPGRPVPGTVAEQAGDLRMLLVLDTCETRLAAAARVVGGVLTGGTARPRPGRRPGAVGAAGELVWRIPSAAHRPGAGRAGRGGPGPAARPGRRRPGRAARARRQPRPPGPGSPPRWPGCRSPSSSPPRGCGCSRRRSSPSGSRPTRWPWSTPGATARPPAHSTPTAADRHRLPRRRAHPVVPRSAAEPRPGCCGGCRCSPGRSTCPRSSGCPAVTRSARWRYWSTSRCVHAEPRTDAATYRVLDADPGVRRPRTRPGR